MFSTFVIFKTLYGRFIQLLLRIPYYTMVQSFDLNRLFVDIFIMPRSFRIVLREADLCLESSFADRQPSSP